MTGNSFVRNISKFSRMGPGTWKGISGNVAGFPFEIRTGSLPNKRRDRFLSTPVCSVACGAILSLFSHTCDWHAVRLTKSSVFYTTIDTRKDITSIYDINKIVLFLACAWIFCALRPAKNMQIFKVLFKALWTNSARNKWILYLPSSLMTVLTSFSLSSALTSFVTKRYDLWSRSCHRSMCKPVKFMEKLPLKVLMTVWILRMFMNRLKGSNEGTRVMSIIHVSVALCV